MLGARPTLVLAAASVLAGAAFDAASLYVPGIALALLVMGSQAWVGLAARRVRIEREHGPERISEGEPYTLLVTIHAGRIPLPGGRLVHPRAQGSTAIGMRFPRRALIEVPSLRRGRHRLEPATLVVSDPFHLRTAAIRAGEGDQVLVLPRIEPVLAKPSRGRDGDDGVLDGAEGGGAGGLDTRSIDFEIDGVRPYRQGSAASRIHWPTVARLGELVEHRLVAGAGFAPLVILDSSSPADDEALDRAVRAAASLCVYLAPRGGCALLLSGEHRAHEVDPQLRAWPQVHARLAVVKGGGPPPAPRRTAPAASLFWVTAAAVPPRSLPAPAGRTGYVVSPSSPGSVPEFTVAGCDGRPLGTPPRAAARARAA
jgi:uncharacterized protein (DUF58 family)